MSILGYKIPGMTKRGKELKMDLSDNYNIVGGTVDNKNAKAVYINISAWGEPTSEEQLNYTRVISYLSKCVRQSVYNFINDTYPDEFFYNRTIVDLDMRESGVRFGKRSFMNCELTLFRTKTSESINEGDVPNMLEVISSEAVECFECFEHFQFNRKKN